VVLIGASSIDEIGAGFDPYRLIGAPDGEISSFSRRVHFSGRDFLAVDFSIWLC
jgi:hypothetical protein